MPLWPWGKVGRKGVRKMGLLGQGTPPPAWLHAAQPHTQMSKTAVLPSALKTTKTITTTEKPGKVRTRGSVVGRPLW